MNKQRIIGGIDVGSSKITTIIGAVGEEKEVKVIGVSTVPSAGIRKGQIVDLEEATAAVIKSVEAAERMAGYSLERILVAVGGGHLLSQNSTGVVAVAEPEEEITHEDVERVVEAARAITLPSSREIIHVIPRFFTVDGQPGIKDPVGMAGVRLEVETHIITGSTTAIKNLIKCISEVGSKIEALVAGGLAAAESVLTETEKELGVILIDIGGGVTNVIIYVEGAPFYMAVLPVGAKNVTNDLAIGLRVSLETAEKIKIALSREMSKEKEESLTKQKDEITFAELGISEEDRTISRKTLVEGIIKPRLNEIFSLVEMEIKKSGAAGLTPAGIVLCGGGAQTVGIVSAAKRTLSAPIRIGIPQKVSGLIDDIQTPEFAVPVGLLLYGAKTEPKEGISFSFGQIGMKIPKIPVGGLIDKAWELLKNLLP